MIIVAAKNKGVVEIKKKQIIIMAVVIVGLLIFNSTRSSETQFPIEKTYTTTYSECSDEVTDYFEMEDNASEVEINGQMTETLDKQHPDYSFFNKKNKYIFEGSIIINDQSFKYEGDNALLFTEVIINDEEVLLGSPEDSANDEDSIKDYDLSITLETNLALDRVTIVDSTFNNSEIECTLENN